MSESALIYARYSPRPKEKRLKMDDGETINHQFAVCEKYCQMRELDVYALLSDEGESARKSPLFDRPEGRKLQYPPKEVKHIVAAKLDRFFRDTINGIQMLKLWSDAGITVHFADQGGCSFNVETATGRLMMRTLLAFGEFEADISSERTSAAMLHRQRNGEIMSSKLPFGQKIDPHDQKRSVPCDYEMQIIHQVKQLRSTGLTYRAIVDRMKDVPLRNSRWSPERVSILLKSTYA